MTVPLLCGIMQMQVKCYLVVAEHISKYHRLIVVLAHGDGILWRHHVPEAIAAQNDIAMLLRVQGHHTCVWLRRHHKFTAVEVVTPEVTCCET